MHNIFSQLPPYTLICVMIAESRGWWWFQLLHYHHEERVAFTVIIAPFKIWHITCPRDKASANLALLLVV